MTFEPHEPLIITFRRIEPGEAAPLRHAVLWPSNSEAEQITVSDRIDGALHYGAFLADPVPPGLISIANVEDPLCLPPTTHSRAHKNREGHFHIQQRPIASINLTPERMAKLDAEYMFQGAEQLPHVQLHKFGVLGGLQGRGIGRRLYEAALSEWKRGHEQDGSFLLHLDARCNQQQMYEKLGFKVVDTEVILKYGPMGNAPGIKYIRMARVCPE